MRTILMLTISNCFMTYAWYGHLKNGGSDMPLFKLILISWGIAFFEYLFMIPANNRYGLQEGFSPFQLKTIQEIISLVVFVLFALFFLKEPLRWNYIVAFLFILGAVYFMFYPFATKNT
ncbi:MAG: DMT family protein [Chitinophagaceae bacterium]|nr:DMT family protein [Chitinophagaceae bacterium]